MKQEDDGRFFSIQAIIQVLEYSWCLLVYSCEMSRRRHGQVPVTGKAAAADINQHGQILHGEHGR